jgi:H+/gluconate symporter-like permease
MTTAQLFLITTSAILLLFVLVIKFKIHAFLALMITSILVGIFTGMPLMTIVNPT